MDANSPIAIVGVAALFPGSTSKEGFWRDILAGRDLMTDVPPSHWLIDDYYDPDPKARDKTYARRGAFLKPIDFDPLAWGVPPSSLPSTDVCQLLALHVAQQVLQDACGPRLKDLNRDRVSVILGVTSAQQLLGTMVSRLQKPVWKKALSEQGLSDAQVAEACERIASHYVEWQESTFPGVLGNVVAGRIANRLDLGGTNCVTDAACASSFSALSMGVSELRLGAADMVITGGADTMNDIFMYVCFSKTPALSPSGDCRPFSDRADGTMLGEGLGMVALKRLADAERDGDKIYALITGIGSSSDGRAKSVYAPVAEGQAKAIRRAYQQAGYGPDTVELVEAHGTGTKAGDAAEFEGLRTVFDESGRKERGWCALGSVKSQVGHTKAAAGAAGLFKAVMSLHHKVLPPTIKVDRPDPRLAIEASPFHLSTVARPWVADRSHPRRASVSSFGFGGSNFHIALEEYNGPSRAPRVRPEGVELLLVSGPSTEAVAARCKDLLAQVPGALPFLAYRSQLSFDASQPVRLAVFADSEAQAVTRLGKAAELVAAGRSLSMPGNLELSVTPREGEVAFIFPGQGSQSLRMGFDVCTAFEAARSAWDEARAAPGERLDTVVFPPPAFDEAGTDALQARLTATEWAQPAIGVCSLSFLRLLQDLGVQPAAVGGHSFGEVTALCAAGVLSAADALRVARRRGKLMAEAARIPGAMVSIAAPIEEVKAALVSWNSQVVVANHNTPSQTVLSGGVEDIAEAERRFAERSISTTRLQVATAFHSPIVAEARAPFREFLEEVDFKPAQLEVYANASAAPYPPEPAGMRELLALQLVSPVRFVEQIEAMYQRGIRTFVEAGPGSVLTGLVGHILKKRPHKAIALGRTGRPGLSNFIEGLGALSVCGVAVSYERLWKDHAAPADPRLTKKPAMVLKIDGAGYGKLYPTAEGAALKKPITALQNSAPPPAAVSPSVQLAFMAAFQETQRQTAEAHALYQKATTDAHLAFLRSADTALSNLSRIMNGVPGETSAAWPAAPAWQPPPQPVAPPAPQVWQPPPVQQMQPPPGWQPSVPPPASRAVAARPAEPPRAAAPFAAAPRAMRSAEELEALMLDVLAASTGYPKEMLRPDLDLEKDLGVDSIKRVEILAAVRDRAPDLPEVSAAEMASKRTLRQIAAVLLGGGGEPAGPSPGGGNGHVKGESTRHAPSANEPLQAAPARRTVRTLLAPVPGLAVPGLFDGSGVVITDDGGGVAEALSAKLNACGAHATVVADVPAGAQSVILLDGLRSPEAFKQVHQAAFRAARAVAPKFTASGGTFISVQDTGGDFGLSGSPRAWLGGLAALIKTARWEWPLATVRALDVERGERSPAAIAQAICNELLEGGGALEVGLRADGSRSTLAVVDAPLAAGTTALSSASVVVVSGGGRGVTASCAIALAKALRCRFLLLGRSTLAEEAAATQGATGTGLKRALLQAAQEDGEILTPVALGQRAAAVLAAREIRATLAAIRAAGGEARYAAADLGDPAAVAAAVSRTRSEWGSIDAVVHGAGVLADKLIQDKTDAQFDRVFDTKVLGLRALLDATRTDDLKALVFFSSVAGRFGNLGQADYAMGNEVLNSVAAYEQSRRGASCIVRALGWGPWDGGMVDDSLRSRFAALGVSLIPLVAGAKQFCDELSGGGPDVELLVGGVFKDQPLKASTRDLVVDSTRQPFLADHRLKGAPVVPVALVAEWFARAARELSPGGATLSLNGLRVLRGIRLGGFDSGVPARFQVQAKAASAGRLELELLGPGGARHFSANGALLPARPVQFRQSSNGSLEAWCGSIYGRKGLFHGPQFQVIERIEGVSEHRLVATLHGTRWPGKWLLDPALLDGGLQVALLWTRHVLGGQSLPTAIDRLDARLGEPAQGSIRCVVEGRQAKGDRSVTDLTFTEESGAVIMMVQGLEAHLLPQTQKGANAWDGDGV
jgi:acyl transferase domain-containing protein